MARAKKPVEEYSLLSIKIRNHKAGWVLRSITRRTISDIKVTVISDRHGQVKLGIEAPEDVEIWREAIFDNRESADGDRMESSV